MTDLEQLSYPIGRFTYDADPTPEKRWRWTQEIRSLPRQLETALEGVDEDGLEKSYRDGGWTIRQLIHHIADAHGNSFYRFKLALTESSPAVKTWEEGPWSAMPDGRTAPVEASLRIISGTHERWSYLLDHMSEADFRRVYRHPQMGDVPLDWLLHYMSWHGRHHVRHIEIARSAPVAVR